MCAEGQPAAPTGGEGPGRGGWAQGRVVRSSRHTQKPRSAAWALEWGAVQGGQGSRAPLPNERRVSWQKGQKPLLSPTPHDSKLFGQRLSTGSGGQESQEREALLRGAKGRGAEALSLPKPESPGDHSMWGCPGGKEGERPHLPGAGLVQGRVLPAFQEPEGNRGPRQGLPAPRGPLAQEGARLSWVFGQLDNSSKR